MEWKDVLRHFKVDEWVLDIVEDIVEDERLEALDDYELGQAYTHTME